MPKTTPASSSPFRRMLDRVARELSPSWFAKRQTARLRAERAVVARELLEDHRARRAMRRLWDDVERRRFDAAGSTPRTQGWLAPLTPPDAAEGTFLDRLRQRSRDLSRNNPWAAKAVRSIPAHLVGSGIRATLTHPNAAVAKRAQELWDRWADSKDADADGRTNLYGLQRLAAREIVEAGECLARFRLRRQSDGLEVPLQVQILEADHLDATKDNVVGFSSSSAADRRRRQGVEFDARGRRVGYWLYPDHPGFGTYTQSAFVPASSVAHVYRVERAGQVRGIPWGAPCLLTLRDLGDWADATILRAKLAACFAAFVTTDQDAEDPDAEAATPTGKDVEELEPGLVEYLKPGQSVSFTNPPGVEGMDSFPTLELQAVAVGYGVPVHVLTGNLKDVNFSSARIGNLDFDAELQAAREDWLVPQFLEPLAIAWLGQAVLAGLLPEGVRFSWTPPPAPLLEPKADLEAAKMRVRCGLSTLSEEQRRAGWRPRELLEEQAADWAAVDQLGLSFETDPRVPAAGSPGKAAAAPGAPGSAQDDADDEEDPDAEEETDDEAAAGQAGG